MEFDLNFFIFICLFFTVFNCALIVVKLFSPSFDTVSGCYIADKSLSKTLCSF